MTTALCDRVHAFVDGELSAEQAGAFRDHLATCTSCQAELEDALQLAALTAGAASAEARRPAEVVSLAWYRRRRGVVVGASIAVAAAAALLLYLRRPHHAADPPPTLALAPTRSIEERVAWAGADQYRRYEVLRAGDGHKAEPIALAELARLEQRGDLHGVAAAYLLDGDWQRADEFLARSGEDPRVRADRAVVLLGTHRPGAALAALDPLLGEAPELGPALWNRALALRDLRLSLTAAAAFDAVAALGEPGWSTEARQRADGLRGEAEQRRHASRQVIETSHGWIRDQAELPADFARADRGLARGFFYELLRAAPTRARVESLRPLAEELERELGTSVLRTHVDRVAAADFSVRGPLATRYGQLVIGAPSPDEMATLRRDARRAGADDILMGLLLRDDGRIDGDEMPEYARLVGRAGDPWFEILRYEMAGRQRGDLADYAGAEAALLEGRAVCQSAPIDFRCGRIEAELGNLYITLNRADEGAQAIERARATAFRTGDWHLQEVTTRLIALVPAVRDDSFGGHFAEARAYLAEAVALRPEECALREWADGELASLLVSQLRFPDARAQLSSGLARDGACSTETPSLPRAFVQAQIASATEDPDLAAEVRSMVSRLREGAPLSADDRIGLDHVEGRVVIATDRAAGQALLRQAIEAAGARSGVGGEGQRFRAYSYSVLVADAARHGEYAEALRFIAEELASPPATRCALGVAVEADLVVVAVGPDGEVAGQSRRLQTPVDGVKGLVPSALLERLDGCAVVDVYARPPLLGQPELLAREMAWRYRVGPIRSAPPASRPQRLVISDVEPPETLGLPRLNPEADAGQPDTRYLRGAAATPRRVREAMTSADEIEIHAHGSVDGTTGDTAWIALSPDQDGSYALTAGAVASTRLAGSPVVFLATCHGGRSASFFHEGGSLALAFVRAGARVVIASTDPLPDRGAAELFAELRQRMSHGSSAAEALRELRGEAPGEEWLRSLVVFE